MHEYIQTKIWKAFIKLGIDKEKKYRLPAVPISIFANWTQMLLGCYKHLFTKKEKKQHIIVHRI